MRGAFESRYRELYGHEGPDVPIEVLNWRVVSSGPRPRFRLGGGRHETGEPLKGERDAFFPGGRRAARVFDRYALGPGTEIEGPAIVEERESTLVVPPGRTAAVTPELAVVVW